MMSSEYTLLHRKRSCTWSVPPDIRQTAPILKACIPRLVAMSTPTSKGKGPVSGAARVKKRKLGPTTSEEEVNSAPMEHFVAEEVRHESVRDQEGCNRFDHTVGSTGFVFSEGVTSAVAMKSVSSACSSNLSGNIETRRGAMPAFQARALQTLHVQLVDELDFQHLKDHLFSNGLIDHHLMVELNSMTPRECTREFLKNLQQSGTNGYQKFLKVLQVKRYVDLKLKIEETLSKQFPTNINIVLIGKTGVGKSLLGNSLLKKPAAFVSKQSMESVTKVCSLQSCKKSHHGKEVTVNIIDSPGLADSNTSTNDIIHEIAKCMELARGRVDVFIVVINAVERMTDEGKAPIHMLKDRYGVESEAFVLIVFTHIDQISDGKNLEDLIKETTFLRETISLFKNRYCSFGKNSEDHDVKDIFNRIFTMIEENNYKCYSHCLFEEAAKNFDDRIAAEKKRLEKEQKMEVDKLTKKIEDKVRMEFEERYTKKPVASQSLKEEQKRKEEELTKKIEYKLRREYDKRYRKALVDIKASASLGMQVRKFWKPVLKIDDKKLQGLDNPGVNSQREFKDWTIVTSEQLKRVRERTIKNKKCPTDSKVSNSPDERSRTCNICTECGQRWNGRGRWLGV